MGKSGVEYCTDSLNPVRGCFPKSSGCANCYAMRLAATRLRQHPKYVGLATYDGRPRWTGEVQLDIDVMREVLSWQKPRTCFVCDMSDLFYEKVPDAFIAAVFGFMAAAPDHRFYIVTKRAARMRRWFADLQADDNGPGHKHLGHRLLAIVSEAAGALRRDEDDHERAYDLLSERVPSNTWPLPNVWLLTSVEDQPTADERIPDLLGTPAVVHGVSYEPALGPVDFDPPTCPIGCDEKWGRDWSPGTEGATPFCNHCDSEMAFGAWLDPLNDGISWLIAGAESGPGARPVDTDWVRSARRQCADAHVPFYLKQWPKMDGIDWPADDRGTLVKLPLLDGVQHTTYPERTP